MRIYFTIVSEKAGIDSIAIEKAIACIQKLI